MGYRDSLRGIQAAARREQREVQRQLRELERQAKENAKLSTYEHARLEVERFEKQLEVILSVHKEQGESWDWIEVASSLPPPPPVQTSHFEFKAKQRAALLPLSERDIVISKARLQDEEAFQKVSHEYSEQIAEMAKFKSLAKRILLGEH
jgi:hypothetical protein